MVLPSLSRTMPISLDVLVDDDGAEVVLDSFASAILVSVTILTCDVGVKVIIAMLV